MKDNESEEGRYLSNPIPRDGILKTRRRLLRALGTIGVSTGIARRVGASSDDAADHQYRIRGKFHDSLDVAKEVDNFSHPVKQWDELDEAIREQLDKVWGKTSIIEGHGVVHPYISFRRFGVERNGTVWDVLYSHREGKIKGKVSAGKPGNKRGNIPSPSGWGKEGPYG